MIGSAHKFNRTLDLHFPTTGKETSPESRNTTDLQHGKFTLIPSRLRSGRERAQDDLYRNHEHVSNARA